MPTSPPIPINQYPDRIVCNTVDLGDLGDTGEPAINTVAQYYVLDQAIQDWTLDHFDLSHDGVASGTGEVYAKLFKLEDGDKISDLVGGDQLGATLTLTAAGASRVSFALSSLTELQRRFSRGDRLVLSLDSVLDDETVSSAYTATTIDNVSCGWLGRTVRK